MSVAIEIPGFKGGALKAGADLSAKQYLAVKVTGELALGVAGAGEQIIGILQNKPISGEAAEIDCDGISLAVLGGVVAAGNILTPDANGKLVVAVADDYGVAIALCAGVLNDIASVKLANSGIQA